MPAYAGTGTAALAGSRRSSAMLAPAIHAKKRRADACPTPSNEIGATTKVNAAIATAAPPITRRPAASAGTPAATRNRANRNHVVTYIDSLTVTSVRARPVPIPCPARYEIAFINASDVTVTAVYAVAAAMPIALQTPRARRTHAHTAKHRKITVPRSSVYAPIQVAVVAGLARSWASFAVDVPTVSSCVFPPTMATIAPASVSTTEAIPAPAKKRSFVRSSIGSSSVVDAPNVESGRGGVVARSADLGISRSADDNAAASL